MLHVFKLIHLLTKKHFIMFCSIKTTSKKNSSNWTPHDIKTLLDANDTKSRKFFFTSNLVISKALSIAHLGKGQKLSLPFHSMSKQTYVYRFLNMLQSFLPLNVISRDFVSKSILLQKFICLG